MALYACSVCGALSEQRRCPAHRRQGNTSWAGNRDRGAQMVFRSAVLDRDGHRCTYIDPASGERCPETSGLRACHFPKPLRDYRDGDPAAYDPDNGVTLCRTHDRMLDRSAR